MARFKPGESGNPAGKPKGAVTKMTQLRKSIEKDVPAILEAMVTAAMDGDTTAARLLLERVMPPLRPQDQAVSLPLAGADLGADGRAIIEATGAGSLTPDQAKSLLTGLGSLARIVETDELLRRIEKLEERYAESS